MKVVVEIVYDSFRLRDDTERVLYSGGAHLFFEDFGIEYKLIDSTETDSRNWIEFKEWHNNFDIEVQEVQELFKMANKYKCNIMLEPETDKVRIKFYEGT